MYDNMQCIYIQLFYHASYKIIYKLRDFNLLPRTHIIVVPSRHVLQADGTPASSLAVGCNSC